MKNKILTFLGSFTGLAVIIILLSLGACISGPTYKNHDFILKDLNYIDNTFAFQLKLPNPTWKIKGELRRFADGHFIAEVTKNGTNLYLYVVISRHHQDSLEKFASAGSFDPTQSNFTFIAGKPAYFYGKNQSASNNQLRVEVYKFVNDNKGYIISLAYPVGLSADNATMEELDELLNSFMFFQDKPSGDQVKFSAGQMIGKVKIENITMLPMIDLSQGKPSSKTRILTTELQAILNRTGKFKFVDRTNLKKITDEQVYQQSGMVSDQTAVEIGQLTGARYLISSNYGKMGKTSVIYMQITDVENGKILKSTSMRCRSCSDDQLLKQLHQLAYNFRQ